MLNGGVGEIFIIDSSGESKRCARSNRKPSEIVKEASTFFGSVGLNDSIQQSSVFCTNRTLVEGSFDLTVLDDNFVVRTAAESQVDVVRDNQRDDVLATEAFLSVCVLDNLWQFTLPVDATEHLKTVSTVDEGARATQQVST